MYLYSIFNIDHQQMDEDDNRKSILIEVRKISFGNDYIQYITYDKNEKWKINIRSLILI